MTLQQKEEGYRYNSDTLILFDFIRSYHPKGSILDVGCGCGILGLLLKRDFPTLDLHLLDIQEDNCVMAKSNALHNGIEVSSLKCNDFLKTHFAQKYDFIVSNPPFYPSGATQSENAHLNMSRNSSSLPFDTFVQKVGKIVSPKGYFIFCYDARQVDTLMLHLHKAGLKIETMRFVYAKETKEASLVLIRARKNSKTLCTILPPLITMDEKGYTPALQEIFSHSNTQSAPWIR